MADDVAVDVGQAAVDAAGAEGELFVIDAEEVEDGGVDIVDFCGVVAVEGFVAEVVAEAVGDAAADAAAGEPVSEAERVVVAAFAALGAGHAAEFGGPEDEGVVEETALFEVFDEGGGAVGEAACERAVVAFDVFVGVPVAAGEAVVIAAPDLDEADPAFEETASGQAFAAEDVDFFGVVDVFGPFAFVVADAVHFAGGGGFFGEVEGVGSGELHACGEFVGTDASVEPVVAGA